MGVNFHVIRESEAGPEEYECDDCDVRIDADHYGDMQAHDAEHYDRRQRIENMPRAVVVKAQGRYLIARRFGGWYDEQDWYTEVGSSNDVDFARKVATGIQDGSID